jgi:hypothetical protein
MIHSATHILFNICSLRLSKPSCIVLDGLYGIEGGWGRVGGGCSWWESEVMEGTWLINGIVLSVYVVVYIYVCVSHL